MQRKVIKLIEKIDQRNTTSSSLLDLHDHGLTYSATTPEIVHHILKEKKSWFKPNMYGLQRVGTQAKLLVLLVKVKKAVDDSIEDGFIEPDRTILSYRPTLRVTGKGRKFIKWFYYPKAFFGNAIVKAVIISVITLIVTYYVGRILGIPQSSPGGNM